MTKKERVVTYESRPIERRGKKRATPLNEMEASYKESIYKELVALQRYTSKGQARTFPDVDVESQVESLITGLGHILRQSDYKRRGMQ